MFSVYFYFILFFYYYFIFYFLLCDRTSYESFVISSSRDTTDRDVYFLFVYTHVPYKCEPLSTSTRPSGRYYDRFFLFFFYSIIIIIIINVIIRIDRNTPRRFDPLETHRLFVRSSTPWNDRNRFFICDPPVAEMPMERVAKKRTKSCKV